MLQHRVSTTWLRAVHGVLAIALLAAGCRQAPVAPTSFQLEMAEHGAGVAFQIKLPKKPRNGGFGVLSGDGEGTLSVNRIDVKLSGPGFIEDKIPAIDSDAVGGAKDGVFPIDSDSVNSNFQFVPPGNGRFVKVQALNDTQKVYVLGGVLNVQTGERNQVDIGLATTPTMLVVERLSRVMPKRVQGLDNTEATAFPHRDLQYWLNTKVTMPQTSTGAGQNRFTSVHPDLVGASPTIDRSIHPYLVDASAIADYIATNNMNIDFKTRGFSVADPIDQKFVLHPRRVKVRVGGAGLPAGSRVWINDPISSIRTIPAGVGPDVNDDIVFPNVAPNFEGDPTARWTVTVATPTKVMSALIQVDRKALNQPADPELLVDMSPAMASAGTDITRLKLKVLQRDESLFDKPYTWFENGAVIKGRVPKQVFAYAETASGAVTLLSPDLIDWRVDDPLSQTATDARLAVGNGDNLSATDVLPLGASGAPLAGGRQNDWGLAYPLGETNPAVATDAIDVVAALITNPNASDTIDFKISGLDADSGRAVIYAQGQKVYLSTDIVSAVPAPASALTLTAMLPVASKSIKLVEPEAPPAGTTYRWVSSHPLVKFVDPNAGPVAQVYCLGAFSGAATITAYSSTGRQAAGTVTTAFGNGTVNTSVTGAGLTASWDMLDDYVKFPENNPAAPTSNTGFARVTGDPDYPLNGYIKELEASIVIGITDPAMAGDATYPFGAYFWRSSDPTYVSVEPYGAATYPTRKARLVSHRQGAVTITAMDRFGRELSTPMQFFFKQGAVNSEIRLPVNPYEISMITTRAFVESQLKQKFATCVMEAQEPNPAYPDQKFTWVSSDPLRLTVQPYPGATFPSKRALLTTLRPGPVTLTLISANTEKVRAWSNVSPDNAPAGTGDMSGFGFNITYNAGAATPNVWTGKVLRMGLDADNDGAGMTVFGTSGTVSGINKVFTLEALDPDPLVTDQNVEPFHWYTENFDKARLLSGTGKRVQVRVMDYGSYVFRVVNTRTNRWGVYTLTVNGTSGNTEPKVRL